MKDLLNVVVGSGIPEYFQNCIASVSRNCPHDILAIYNHRNKEDHVAAKRVAAEWAGQNIAIITQPNEGQARTGSLYAAYNRAIDAALGRYRYISFIQADMQMMWWDDAVIDKCDEALTSWALVPDRKLCFYSQLPVRGKRVDFYANWRDDHGGFRRTHPGAVDVAIYPLREVFGDGHRFEGSESDFSRASAEAGVNIALHPLPFLAPIPFPVTVRTQGGRARKAIPQQTKTEVLKSFQHVNSVLTFDRDSFHPLFMEDFVGPNGWNCLTPYWPSDARGIEWFRVRWLLARKGEASLISVQLGGRGRRLFKTAFEPGIWPLARSAMSFYLREARIAFLPKKIRQIGVGG